MKLSIITILAITLISACQNSQQSEAKKLAGEIKDAVAKNTPGFIATSKDQYWMSAKIDGKDWTASAMLPIDKSDSRRIQAENNGESIGFYIWMRGLEAGKHLAFSESSAADLFTNDDVGIWGARSGEIIITKIDDVSLEGTFSFTATSSRSDKKLQVTEGRFRVPAVAGK